MSYKWAVMLCLMPTMTLVTVDMTIVNVALAKLGAVFGVDVAAVGWTVTGFALAMGVATPMASFVETRFTLKRVWVLTMALFTGGSMLCGLSPAFWVLIVGRVLQGAAAGLLFPMAMSALLRVFPSGERGAAMGLLVIPIVAGPAFGPTVGGYIVTYMDWRMVFFVNLPIGVLAVVVAALLLRSEQPQRHAHLDAVGVLLSSLGFGSCLYGLSSVSQDGWSSPTVQGFIGFGLLSLVALCAYELTQDEPLLDVRLFALPQFLIGNVMNWVGSIALLGAEFMLPLYLQNLRGLTALDTGLLLMPQGLAIGLSAPMAGRLIDRIGARPVAVLGVLLLALNTWDLSRITLNTSLDTLRWLLVLRGLALGFMATPPKLTAMEAAPEQLRTNGSSMINAMQSVFQSLGVAWLATVVQTQTVVHTAVLGWQVRPDTLPGMAVGQISAALQAGGGLPPATANVDAVALMVRQVTTQATTLAFGDAYLITFFAALLAIPLALLLPGRGAVRASQEPVTVG